MKNKKALKTLFLPVIFSLFTVLFLTNNALAEINFGSLSESAVKTAGFVGLVALLLTFVPFASASSVLETLLNWLLSIFTFLSIISFVITGIMFIFSGSDPNLREKAKGGLIYSIIGIAVGISGYIILNTIYGIMGGSI